MDYLSMIQSIPVHRTALIEDGHIFTYGEIAREACQLRAHFPASKEPGVVWITDTSVHGQLVQFLAFSGTCLVPVIVPGDMKHMPEHPHGEDIPPHACMGFLTSGTTGQPRLWFRTRESWSGFFPVQNSIFNISSDTRLFAQGSLAFTGNLNLCLSLLSAGAAVITATAANPVIWRRAIEDHCADTIYLIPSKLRLLPMKAAFSFPQVKTILTGSQSFGLKDMEVLKNIFPNSTCYLYYGASELSYVTWLTDQEMNRNPACIGKPFPGVHVTLRGNEIYADTPCSAIGITGPYSVGDTGYMDENGYLYFDGRKDSVYNIHGRKISAVKVENALIGLEEIKEAAVVLWEGSLRAHIVLAAPESVSFPSDRSKAVQSIKKKLHAYLESWEIPRSIIIQKDLPKNSSGKVIKRRLNCC